MRWICEGIWGEWANQSNDFKNWMTMLKIFLKKIALNFNDENEMNIFNNHLVIQILHGWLKFYILTPDTTPTIHFNVWWNIKLNIAIAQMNIATKSIICRFNLLNFTQNIINCSTMTRLWKEQFHNISCNVSSGIAVATVCHFKNKFLWNQYDFYNSVLLIRKIVDGKILHVKEMINIIGVVEGWKYTKF